KEREKERKNHSKWTQSDLACCEIAAAIKVKHSKRNLQQYWQEMESDKNGMCIKDILLSHQALNTKATL
ncbi:hypothetical protein NDU88_010583, partial [Pleurodeles waltl]